MFIFVAVATWEPCLVLLRSQSVPQIKLQTCKHVLFNLSSIWPLEIPRATRPPITATFSSISLFLWWMTTHGHLVMMLITLNCKCSWRLPHFNYRLTQIWLVVTPELSLTPMQVVQGFKQLSYSQSTALEKFFPTVPFIFILICGRGAHILDHDSTTGHSTSQQSF